MTKRESQPSCSLKEAGMGNQKGRETRRRKPVELSHLDFLQLVGIPGDEDCQIKQRQICVYRCG